MALSPPKGLPGSSTSGNSPSFLGLPTEVHVQIYKYLFDDAKPSSSLYGETVGVDSEKTELPHVASVLLTCRRCYLEGKRVILSNNLVRLKSPALHCILHRWRGRPDYSQITKLSFPIWRDGVGPRNLTGYISCKRLTEIFPRLAQLQVDICYTEHCTFPFDDREITHEEVARQLCDTVTALMRGGFPRMGDWEDKPPYLLWLRHVALTRMGDPSQCPFDVVLLAGLELSNNYPRDYTIGRMNVLDGILRFRIREQDFAVKQAGFGPDYKQDLSLWYEEEEAKLQESVAYWEHYHGRRCMQRPWELYNVPFDSTCGCGSRQDCDAQTNPIGKFKEDALNEEIERLASMVSGLL